MHGHEALARGPPAKSYGGDDLFIRPVADARLAVRCDIRRVDRPEGAIEFLTARIRLSVRLGVTAAAAGGPEDVLAAGDVGRIRAPGGACRESHQTDHQWTSEHGTYANARRR